ncbi:glycosyltransferase [Methylobacter sp.]|uniref:glycosyltransferase n=1 Tax=Methylobacter sp. TaxID=2051955 RepID=UPI002FDE9AF8
MSNIVFCFPPIVSTINSSLKLARELKLRGNTITYIGIADCQPVIHANGFEFVPVYEKWFPKGCFEDRNLIGQSFGDNDFVDERNFQTRFNAFLNFLMAGGDDELQKVVQTLQPDLVIISTSLDDSIVWALLIYKMKLKCMYLFDVLGGVASHTVPPIYTELMSDGSLWSTTKIIAAWLVCKVKKFWHERYSVIDGPDLLSFQQIRKLANYCNYPYKNIACLTDMPSPQLNILELVLFPQQFDFPGAKRNKRYYAEASIDLDRVQEYFPWERINDDRPLVYSALGTLTGLTNSEYENFFNTVIDASTKWPDWNWVISIGNNLKVEHFKSVFDNVIIVNRAPQLELLKKASLMITHGGPNSVKECIYFGVPMIVFPLWFDQPGNVARVTYHGLGLKGDFKKISQKELQGLIEEVTSNPKYRERIKAMQKYFMEIEEAKPSVKLIEEFIAKPNTSSFF